MSEAVEIRVLLDADVPTVLDIHVKEGWNTPRNVFLAARAWDPDGVLVALDEEGKLIGTLGACNLDDNTGFYSSFYVDKKLRGKGVGSQLMTRAMAHLGNRNILVNSTMAALDVYERKGFKIKTFSAATFTGIRPEHIICSHSPNNQVTLVNFEAKYHDALLDYDQSVHILRRQKYMDQFMAPETQTILALCGGNIVGYGCVQPRDDSHDCFFIGPVYADDDSTAQLLIVQLLEKIPQGKLTNIIILFNNKTSVSLMTSNGFVPGFEIKRMYTEHGFPVVLEKVYAITAHEGAIV